MRASRKVAILEHVRSANEWREEAVRFFGTPFDQGKEGIGARRTRGSCRSRAPETDSPELNEGGTMTRVQREGAA